ncbi:hypothetical protein GCM10023324_00350 [Streptomyces youssoufiensis]
MVGGVRASGTGPARNGPGDTRAPVSGGAVAGGTRIGRLSQVKRTAAGVRWGTDCPTPYASTRRAPIRRRGQVYQGIRRSHGPPRARPFAPARPGAPNSEVIGLHKAWVRRRAAEPLVHSYG